MHASLRTFLFLSGSLLAGLATGAAAAAIFPDVPVGHLFEEPINALVNAGVLTGNPDGKFYPDRQVNRAEMLKMLYKATGRLPDVNSRGCFSDVERYGWYENYVCDAAANHFVEGYSDGTFRPSNSVNRVEALKMITQVIGIPVENIGEEALQVVKFVDVSTSAWYTKYLYAAYVKGILPIAGQDASRFYPDWPLLRGEAAAMIFNALNADLIERRQGSSSSVSSARSSVGASIQPISSSSSSSLASSYDVPFPFESAGKFTLRKSVTYRFTLDNAAVVSTVAKLQSGQPGNISCRLYLMAESGFSFEYFMGFQEGSTCTLKTTLKPGSYQLQLQPTSADTTFSVKAETLPTGDGSDGFGEAQTLPMNLARTGTLAPGDYQDWFKFTVSAAQTLQVSVTDSTQLTCLIYPMEDVDLYGFSGPACGQRYEYQPGTYVIAVGRMFPSDARQTYTILAQ
ncbi:MAG: S-layer homology domain-containing protein [Candidatus Peribacteraceae bacterium]|nr:S-layer homology domain-containing protein [Candidatus Peribacteraceae bacterium]MDD5739731.1 S-layer homology domain-containing protein [Candidatus Peribacteraceae bacterium]